MFEYDGAKLRIKEKARGDFCLDVKDGNLNPGNQIQMWTVSQHRNFSSCSALPATPTSSGASSKPHRLWLDTSIGHWDNWNRSTSEPNNAD